MLEQSLNHLTTADENRELARILVTTTNLPIAAFRWSAVMAFYAGAHYVNAYLWERLQLEPTNHEERSAFVGTVADLRPIRRHYIRLLTTAFDARYVPGFRISRQTAQDLLDTDLEAVRNSVLVALGNRQ